MDGSMRRIASCLCYEVNKDHIFHLKDEDTELYRKILLTELAIDLRKWQTYSQKVTKLDQLTEEQLAKQTEQKEAIEKGEEIPTEDLIKDPEPYEVTETYCIEFEKEAQSYEEFLLMFKNEYPEARAEKWKAKLHKLIPKLTNGEEVVENLIKDIDICVNFWKAIKENPESQINAESLKEHPKFLEFMCKALQRIIELGEKSTEEVQGLVSTIVLDEESMQDLEENIKNTKNSLAKDNVQRRQNRFNLIEEKVKHIQESSETSVNVSMVDLDKLFKDIRKELASSEQFQKSEYGVAQLRYFLQISQFLYLKAMVNTLIKRKSFEYRKDTGLPAYQNIQLLDFHDLITQVSDFNSQINSARQRIRNDMVDQMQKEKEEQENPPDEDDNDQNRIPDEEDIEVPVDERIRSISEVINLLSRCCQYSQVSKSWVLLENAVKYTWNLISYELVSPLELSQTDAYKDIFLITECVLNLLSHSKLSASPIDDQSSTTEGMLDNNTIKLPETTGPNKAPKVQLNDADMKFYCSFIAYTIQCLFVAEKWESMVDLADIAAKQLLSISPDPDDDLLFLLGYLLQFRIHGEDKLYSEARQRTSKVKHDLEVRIQEFNHWKATSKKSKSRTALLTGEVPKEELQFRKDKADLEKEAFRLEVHETILKSDKDQSEIALDRIKKSSNNTREALRQCRKLYKKFGMETRELDREYESQGYNKMLAVRKKNHAVMTNMVINSYNKAIELIRKRQEKFLLIQSLHEVGNLYYSDNQLRHAENSME